MAPNDVMATADRNFDHVPPKLEHPRGTLALVILMGVFFAVGWLAMFLWSFLERGALHAH